MNKFDLTTTILAVSAVLALLTIVSPTPQDGWEASLIALCLVCLCGGLLLYVLKGWRPTAYGIVEALIGAGLMVWTIYASISSEGNAGEKYPFMLFLLAMVAWMYVFVSGLNNIREGLKTDPFRLK